MNIRTILTILLSIVLVNTFAQRKEFSIIGKWQQIAYRGNDGAKDYVQKIEDGEILSFEKNSMVKDSSGNIGYYAFNDKYLNIKLNNRYEYFLAFYSDNDSDTLYLAPTNSKYQCICDEGCAYTYVRRKEKTPSLGTTVLQTGQFVKDDEVHFLIWAYEYTPIDSLVWDGDCINGQLYQNNSRQLFTKSK